jgi:hypothetical protein
MTADARRAFLAEIRADLSDASQVELARVLEVSEQRMSQLANEARSEKAVQHNGVHGDRVGHHVELSL